MASGYRTETRTLGDGSYAERAADWGMRMMSNSGVGYPDDDTLRGEQETSAPALPREPAEPAAEPMPSDQSAIRAAFLARQADPGMASPGALGEGADLGGATLRSAYLKRLSEDKTEAIGGAELTGDAVLRGVYAARASAPPAGRAVITRRTAPKKASAARKKPAKAKAGRAKKAKAPARKARAKAAAAGKRARKTSATRKAGTTRKVSAKKKGRGRAKR